MAGTSWKISGDYSETCTCDYVCPCSASGLKDEPTKGYCDAVLAFRIDNGHYGDVNLDGVKFVMMLHSPGVMIDGDFTVGLITDERTSEAQQQAIHSIASGQAGGPMAALAPLVGKLAGAQSAPIEYEEDGNSRTLNVPGLVTQTVDAVTGADPNTPMYFDNMFHPVTDRLAFAKSAGTHFSVFGMNYDSDGGNNGHIGPFTWEGEG